MGPCNINHLNFETKKYKNLIMEPPTQKIEHLGSRDLGQQPWSRAVFLNQWIANKFWDTQTGVIVVECPPLNWITDNRVIRLFLSIIIGPIMSKQYTKHIG